MNFIDPEGLERKPGKTPPTRWPAPPKEVVGKKPKWNPEGYWEGKGKKATWDDQSHGAGVDRGDGPQGGHWDDECSDNRWDEDGNLLPGSPDLEKEFSISDWEYWEEVTGLTGAALVTYLIISEGSRLIPARNLVPVP